MVWEISLTYYDKILIAIAASLGSGFLVGLLTAVELSVAVLVGALIATIFVYDAMFRNPPRPARPRQTKAAAVVWHLFLCLVVLLAVY